MEKSRNRTRHKWHSRLLAPLMFCVHFAVGFSLGAQDIASLQFSQVDDFIVSKESSFTVAIEDVIPSNIEIITRPFSDGISFVSSTKRDGFIRLDDGEIQKATTITYTLRFSKEGLYNLGALSVIINSSVQSIAFPAVTVLPNPEILVPTLHIDFLNPLYSLHESTFVVSAKHFQKIESLTVGLSEDALIEQNQLYLSIPSEDIAFKNDSIPLASYACTPFSEGAFELPPITATFIAYNGMRHEVQLEQPSVSVLAQRSVPALPYGKERSFINNGQDDSLHQGSSAQLVEKNTDFVNELAALRIDEKYKVFPFEATAERKKLEESASLQNGNEVSYPLTIVCIVISGILFFIGFVLYLLKKYKAPALRKNGITLFIICAISMLCVSFFYGRPLLKQHALVYGSNLYAIPEYGSNGMTPLYAGIKVEIQRSAGDWYLVSQPDGRTGWVLKENCIVIEKN